MIPIHSLCEYIRNPKGGPEHRACIVSVKRDDGTIGIGHAFHNPKDPFDRKLMHTIALGRAKKATNVIVAPSKLKAAMEAKLKEFKIRCTKYYKVDIDDIAVLTMSDGPDHSKVI